MPNLSDNIARVFTDVHHGSVARPAPQGNDLYIDVDGTGALNPSLDALLGWDSIPAHIRSGWYSRSVKSSLVFNFLGYSNMNSYYSAVSENGIVIAVSYYNVIRRYDLRDSGIPNEIVYSSPIDFFFRVQYAGNGVFYVCGKRDSSIIVFKSIDYGSTWNEIYYGSAGTNGAYVLSVKNEMELIVSSSSFYTLKSVDGGVTWTDIGNKGSRNIFNAVYANNHYIFVGSSNSANSYISRSLDGITFSTVYSAIDGGKLFSVAFVSDMVGYACGCKSSTSRNINGYILKTIDGGVTWNEIYYNPNFGIGGIAFKNPQEVYFACSYASTSYLGGLITFDAGSTFRILDNVISSWSISNKPIYYDGVYYNISDNIFKLDSGFKLKIGEQNCKRFSFFHIKHTPLEAISVDSSTISVLEINLQLKQATTGAGKFYGMLYFVDVNGFPITVTADIGYGLKNYIGWGVEYTNDLGNIKITRLVAIEQFTYPASSNSVNDDILTVADTLLTLNETTIFVEQLSNVRIIPLYYKVYNNVYNDNGNGEPDLSMNPLISNETVLPESVKNFIFNNRFTTGMLGEGGAGSTDGEGLIDNFAVRWV